jgi:hypothetical protein
MNSPRPGRAGHGTAGQGSARHGAVWPISSILDDILSLAALAVFNVAIALLLYGIAPDIAAWVAR